MQALQSIVSRNADPQHAAVLSVTKIHSGSAYNVIPQEATLGGTTRFFDAATGELMRQRMRTVAAGIAATFEMEIDVEIRSIFDVLVNHEDQSDAAAKSIAKIVGAENLLTDVAPIMGSEDFADMLRAVPGAYFWVGHVATCRCTILASSWTRPSCPSAPACWRRSPPTASRRPEARHGPLCPAVRHDIHAGAPAPLDRVREPDL